MRYTYQHNGQTYTLSLSMQTNVQFTVSIGERTIPLQIQNLPNGGWRLHLDGQTYTIYSAAQGDQRFVQVDSDTYTLTVPNAKPTRRKSSTQGDELTAQMPGQVNAVLVQAGDVAARGQTLLILEAMKMEIRVTAPTNGLVQQVLVQAGDVVERGQHLVIFEPTE